MNTGSPLTKDQKFKPDTDTYKKPKQLINSGTVKKILKLSDAVIGASEVAWFNRYMENKVAGECLPKSFLSNDIYAEICRTYGSIGSTQFILKIVTDFKRDHGLVSVSSSEHDETISCTEDNACKLPSSDHSSEAPECHP
jgi:hypothetical protein